MFLEGMRGKLNIQTPKDWGRVSIQDVKAFGGISYLNYYEGSLYKCLQNNYRGIYYIICVNFQYRYRMEKRMVSNTLQSSKILLERFEKS